MKRLTTLALTVVLGACGPGVDPEGPPQDTVPPSVSNVSPQVGAKDVAQGASVSLVFSEAMNRGGTQAAFQVLEPKDLTGTFTWTAGDQALEFRPGRALPAGTEVRWILKGDAPDAAGNRLGTALVGHFTVGAPADGTYPSATGVTPATDAQDVLPTDPLRVTFSEPMNHAATEAAFFVSKPEGTQGTVSWEGNTLVFTPKQPWPLGAQVTWGVGAGARDAGEAGLARAVTTSFTTDGTRPTVQGASDPGEKGVPRLFQFTVTFSEPMNRATTEAAFAVTATVNDVDQPLPGELTWNAQGTQLTFKTRADSPAPYGAFINWSVTGEATDLAGNRAMGFGSSRDFRILQLKERVILSTAALDGAIAHSMVNPGNFSVNMADLGNVYVGDVEHSSFWLYRAFFSFDLSAIEAEATRILDAEMSFYVVASNNGSAITRYSGLRVEPTDYGTELTSAAWKEDGSNAVRFTETSSGFRAMDATELVRSRWSERGKGTPQRLQYRVYFPETSFPQSTSNITVYTGAANANSAPRVVVHYEMP
ncbi:Ig-like domain-containing protein [Myxococcaceae bacterium GXIMD 01537]